MSRANYRSERRQQQAAATRQAILDAARALFVDRGYARTTVADIAAGANVAVPTVYVSVGPKPAILGELRKQIPVLARVPENTESEVAQATDPVAVVTGFVVVIRRLMQTSGDLMFAIESAAPFEPVAAEAWEEGLVLHRAGWAIAVDRLEALGALKSEMSASKAVDVLSLLSLPSTWRTLGHDDGWTYDEIEGWIVETAISLIFDSGPIPRRSTPGGSKNKRARA